MTSKEVLTQYKLKQLLNYNPDTGVFTWLIRNEFEFTGDASYNAKKWNMKHAGKVAGALRKSKNRNTDYIRIRIQGKSYYAHRLAHLYMTGEWPDQIDHDDGNGLHNWWDNINNVTHKINHKNMPKQRNNTSGLPGVYWCKADKRWVARIKVNNKNINLGRSSDFFVACCIRKSGENKFEFHANHGRVQHARN